MAYEYPKEVYEQQAKVKREIEKLARMRTEHLIATGQMPAPVKNKPASSDASRVASSSTPSHP